MIWGRGYRLRRYAAQWARLCLMAYGAPLRTAGRVRFAYTPGYEYGGFQPPFEGP